MQILIPFYSLYGHTYALARAVASGVEKAGGVPKLRFAEETLPPEVLEKMNAPAPEIRGAQLPSPTPDEMAASAGIIFGCPTRFGGMPAQMRAFLDRCGGLWVTRALSGKVGGSFVSTNTQHGGQETTHFAFHTFMLHHDMLISGAGFSHPSLSDIKEVNGGSPYGAGVIAREGVMPAACELEQAAMLGEKITCIAFKLAL
ncbi:MAG: NAD(P)H:quinone oxidoreductase [Desulfovibrionaceae bacterium]|nr:NAD(P)H:quinone oxidoreductase [Desulfovibrionaceae bacterium]